MAVKASVTITISKYRDTSNITRYYKLQASTASKPAKPTTLTPSGWTDTEPTYTSGSTNTLYFVDRYVFSDGTFQYTEVSKSTSYEAAKEAYNKAQAAQNTINNLKVGTRNYISHNINNWANGHWKIPNVGEKTVIEKYNKRISLKKIIEIEPNTEYWIRVIAPTKPDTNVLFRICDAEDNFLRSATGLQNVRFTSGANDKFLHLTLYENVELNDILDGIIKIKFEKGNIPTDWTPAPEDIEGEVNDVSKDLSYFKETTFATYKREQELNDQGIKNRLSRTEVTVYGDPEDPNDPKALINHVQKVDNDLNGAGGAIDRIEAAEGTIDGTGLNEYDQRIKISQRFLDIETDVESIKNIFNMTGGTNLIQNSVGYFANNDNKPTMWDITSNTIYTPFGYDGDLTGVTVSRGRLFCAKGSIKTTANNIIALLSNKMISISFKYKNGANATSKIKIFNGSTIYFEKTFNTAVNQWTEYKFNPNTDPALANPTFLNTSNSLQISIESANSTNNNGFEISDLMLNYGNVKPWELSSNEVYGAMVKLSSLGIEVTATTANTKNFMTTDGILVYRYDSKTDKIIGTEPITKITDNGTVTNKLESTGDIIERNLIHTIIKDASNNDVYVEYIR